MTFQADIQEIAPVVDRVMAIAAENGCAKGKEFEVELSLHEALVNAILHGRKGDVTKESVERSTVTSRDVLRSCGIPAGGFHVKSLPSPLVGDGDASHGRGSN